MGCGMKVVNWQLLCEQEMRGVSVEWMCSKWGRGGVWMAVFWWREGRELGVAAVVLQ